MGQKKLQRFAELETFSNVLQFPDNMAGQWHHFFKNENPIILELACGKGEYAVGLGEMYPEKNFIGIDLKGNRIWVGAKKALEEGLTNVAFLRTQIDQVNQYFAAAEVNEIWITFPDPQLRFSKAKKRLTHPKFLRLYQQFLVSNGLIHLKTDSPALYEFTRTVISFYGCKLLHDIKDIYKGPSIPEELKIKTYYESLDIAGANQVHYLCFSLPADLGNKEKDAELKERLKEYEGPKDSPVELVEGVDYYIDEKGYVVLTEKFHLEKGYCCGNGCRHCPYEYENVPEPKKSKILELKDNKE